MTCIGWLAVAAGLVRLLFARRTSSAHPRHDWFGRDFSGGRLAGRPGTGGGPDAYRRRAGYSPEAADVRLSRHRDRGGEAGPDRPGRPAAPARLAGAVRRPRWRRVRDGRVHRVAVCCRGADGGGRGRARCRASGHRRRPRPQAACQDRQDRLPASADAAGRGAAARVLGAAAADPGVPGAAGDLSRPAGRAYGVGAADPRGVLPPGRPRLGESFLRSEQGMAELRAASAAHLSPAGQMQIGTAVEMIAVLEDRLHDVRRQVQEAAAALAGARALRERLYGVGPITALALTCWLAGADRFSSSRKAVRFTGLDITVCPPIARARPGGCRGRDRRSCAGRCRRPARPTPAPPPLTTPTTRRSGTARTASAPPCRRPARSSGRPATSWPSSATTPSPPSDPLSRPPGWPEIGRASCRER